MYIGDRTATVLRSQRFATQQTIGQATTNCPYNWMASELFAWQRRVLHKVARWPKWEMAIILPNGKNKGLF